LLVGPVFDSTSCAHTDKPENSNTTVLSQTVRDTFIVSSYPDLTMNKTKKIRVTIGGRRGQEGG
jgi:hypothetical protein